MSDDIVFDLFHCCALVAFVEQAREQQGWPECEATRRRAFALYEQELRRENETKARAQPASQRVDCADDFEVL